MNHPIINILKTLFLSILIATSFIAKSETTVFGLTLNKTTETELLKKHPDAELLGTSIYNKGNLYSLPVNQIELSGLKELITIFDKSNNLVYVEATISTIGSRDRFKTIKKGLSKKYKLIKEKMPFVGDKYLEYKNDDILIFAREFHMGGFQMYIEYTTIDFHNEKLKTQREEKENKTKKEESLL